LGVEVERVTKLKPLQSLTFEEGEVKEKVLSEYEIGLSTIKIVDIAGRGYYIVKEPRLSEDGWKAYRLIIDRLLKYMKPPERVEDPASIIEESMWRIARESKIEKLLENNYEVVRYYILRDLVGYGKIDVLMKDPHVEEIAVEGPNIPVAIIHRDFPNYRWLDTNIAFYGEHEIRSFVQRLALRGGRSISTAKPIVEVKLPEGHRAALTYSSEVSGRGSSFVIRKFPEKPLTITHLITANTLNPIEAAYLWMLIEAQLLIFIIGPMASGKTTLLQALTSLIPPDSRVITVEDSPELRLYHEHWDPLYTRRSFYRNVGEYDITLEDLVKFAWRRRAEYIIVGEVRGSEVQALVQAAASGHGGLTTFHADSVKSMVLRLQSPPLNVSDAFISSISCVVTVRRARSLKSGQAVRRAIEIHEFNDTVFKSDFWVKVFEWNPVDDEHYPKDVKEVFNKSLKLKMLSRMLGITSKELIEVFEDRVEFIEELVEKRIYDYNELAKEVSKYYSRRGITL